MPGRGQVGKEAPRGLLPRSVHQVVSLVLILGALSVVVVWVASPLLTAPAGVPTSTTLRAVAVFVLLAAAGELVSVRIWRGSTSEDLTYLEAVLVAAVLTMPPLPTIAATLAGLLIASIVQRRDWPKTLFNIGSYTTSTAAMILIYYGLADGATRFGIRAVLALLAATFAFSLINTGLLSLIFHVVGGSSPAEYIADEWRLSGTMAVGGVGVGATAVFLADNEAWALLPFIALPALALWLAYGAAAQHVNALERNRWLVLLGGLLAQQGQGLRTLEESAEAIRQIVGAPELAILHSDSSSESPDPASERILASTWTEAGPRALEAEELPKGWQTGVVTQLDVGSIHPGALLLGSTAPYRRSRIAGRTRGWQLDDADAPVLGALVAAVGSAMRAGAAFSALTEETAKMTAVVDNTSDGIAMVDDSGHVRLWSQTMARMSGIDADALADDAEQPEIVRTVIQASRDGQAAIDRAPVQVHLEREDGEHLDVSISTVRVRESVTSASGDEAGWVSILTVHDETRERRVERMKTDFVATISHELRTPITPIKGYAHLLVTRGDRMTTEKRNNALQLISDRADHLARLVDDLLMASRVSDGTRLAIEMGVEDLDVVVRQAVASFPQMAKRISVELPDEPVELQCDRVRAIQCLSNLLHNAEKYTAADSPIEVRTELNGLQVRIHVRDHGAGIPLSEQDRVFERFYRREDPFTMRTGGAGLGLHIARELAVAMGGGLTLETPAEGTGAEFVLSLPTSEAPPVTVAQAAGAQGHGVSGDARNYAGGDASAPPARPGGTMDLPQEPRLANK